jgi:hypothetical protein
MSQLLLPLFPANSPGQAGKGKKSLPLREKKEMETIIQKYKGDISFTMSFCDKTIIKGIMPELRGVFQNVVLCYVSKSL